MGRIDIRICEARNLPDTQSFGKPDPYCIVRCENHMFKTRVIDNNLNPKWEEVFKFQIADENSAQLRFEVWNSNVISDELLGMYTLSVAGLKKGLVKDQWHLLQKCKGNSELRIRMCALDFGLDPTPEEKAQMQQAGVPQMMSSINPAPQPNNGYPAQQPRPQPQQQYPPQQQQYPPQQQQYPPQQQYPSAPVQPQYQAPIQPQYPAQPQYNQPSYSQPQYQAPPQQYPQQSAYPAQQYNMASYPAQPPAPYGYQPTVAPQQQQAYGYPPQQPAYPQQPSYPQQAQGYPPMGANYEY